MLKAVRRKVIYLLVATFLVLMLVGTPVTAPVYAGDCPSATGSLCP